MAITSKSDICNMAVSSLGNFGSVHDIDTPTTDPERICALWYDICRQFVLKQLMPNFALARIVVGKLAEVPPFGYAYYYEYPNNALKILGINDVEDKENNYNIEQTPSGVKAIGYDADLTDGMNLRYVKDVQDINAWSVEAKMLLGQYVAAYICLAITQDANKASKLKSELPAEINSASGVNAQENMPVRISHSRFKEARRFPYPKNTSKK